jgi:uncharacterized protein DUF1722
MTTFARPRIVISRCIDFDSCLYNGDVVRASLREELEPHIDFVPVCLESFRKGRLPVSALAEVLRSWSGRFGNLYLGDQTYLSPFPVELVRLEPLGRKRRRGVAKAA